jgi:AraC family transcriptional activator of mtrCDE
LYLSWKWCGEGLAILRDVVARHSIREMHISRSANDGRLRVPVAAADLDHLIDTLMVRFVWLSECLVGEGYRLEMGGIDAPGIHYNIVGTGRLIVGDGSSIELRPHTLIVVPGKCPFRIEVPSRRDPLATLKTVDGRARENGGGIHRFVANDGAPDIILICGFFHASYGSSTDLFGSLAVPIVEQFDESDQVDQRLRMALAELVAQEIGSSAMSSALLKQVIVALLRRSLRSMDLWLERFALLGDPQIARAFADMVAYPGASHSVESLARTACLSRSAFMARFRNTVGRSPMTVLRDLRMRQAADLLRSKTFTVDEVMRQAGYASRSSFIRAFQKAYGCDPSSYRKSIARSGNV